MHLHLDDVVIMMLDQDHLHLIDEADIVMNIHLLVMIVVTMIDMMMLVVMMIDVILVHPFQEDQEEWIGKK